jgi:hypothetical protein
MDGVTPTATKTREGVSPAMFRAAIYLVAFVTGAIVMGFEMLGSRYLNPHFGNGIYTWAALISTVLAALTAGHFLGGFLADRTASATVLGAIIALASVYLLLLPSFADAILRLVSESIDDVRLGSLDAALAIMFLPVMLLGVYSPFAVRLVLQATQRSGTVSGAVYGVSTFGSIAGHARHDVLPDSGDRIARHHALARGHRAGVRIVADRARPHAPEASAVRRRAPAVHGRRARVGSRRRGRTDRPEPARADAQARGWPHCASGNRVQRPLHRQARLGAWPEQPLRLRCRRSTVSAIPSPISSESALPNTMPKTPTS